MGVLGAARVDLSDRQWADSLRLHTRATANSSFVSFQTPRAENKCRLSVRMADWFDAGAKQYIYVVNAEQWSETDVNEKKREKDVCVGGYFFPALINN